MLRFCGFLFCLISVTITLAQDLKEQFEKFKSQDEQEFERVRQQQDSIFAKAIIDNWRAINLNPLLEKESEPKPEQLPVSEPSLEILNIEHQFIETQPKLMRSFKPTPREFNPEYEPELEKSFAFFGEELRIRYSSKLLVAANIQVKSKHDLAEAWQTLSKAPYQPIVRALHEETQELQLPDFGYLLLLESFLSNLNLSSESVEVYKWFFLVKSGYKARVGLIDGSPVLVIGSLGKIYGKRYYSSAGVNYYILSEARGELESYIIEADADNAPFDLAISEEIRLPLKHDHKEISYNSKLGENVNVKILYNKNVIDLVAKFPQADIAYYLSSKPSDLLGKSLETSLMPYLEGKEEVERINFLLEFVQKGFAYKSDSRQFGKERVMYPEELFFYPFSDCDDRVVLLAHLLREFADVPMVAISFPQHVALGLKLASPIFGESIKYNGYNFTFCDPTYLNAPLGSIIPSANKREIRVIEF